MSRIYVPEKFLRPQNRDTLLAFFTFVDNDTGLEYSNWRLLNGSNGPFVSAPSEAYDHPEKGMQYYPYVRAAYDSKSTTKRSPKGDEFMQLVTEAVYAAYEKKVGGVSQNEAPPATSARGPVANKKKDGLPF